MFAGDVPSSAVLVVIDDDEIGRTVCGALANAGYRVEMASSGAEALAKMTEPSAFNLAVVAVSLPGIDGLAMCRTLRRRGNPTPVLLLASQTAVADCVAGLDAGADDYLTNPFDVEELLARVRAVLRRVDPRPGSMIVKVDDLCLDVINRTAMRGTRPFELTKTEFELLHLLMTHPGVVMTREAIYDEIWGTELAVSSRSLDVYISYLRQKTEAGGESRMIQTVRGTGFRMCDDDG